MGCPRGWHAVAIRNFVCSLRVESASTKIPGTNFKCFTFVTHFVSLMTIFMSTYLQAVHTDVKLENVLLVQPRYAPHSAEYKCRITVSVGGPHSKFVSSTLAHARTTVTATQMSSPLAITGLPRWCLNAGGVIHVIFGRLRASCAKYMRENWFFRRTTTWGI